MPGFYERRSSRAAIWCQRLAVLCIPYFALTILFHRFAKVTTPQTYWLLAFGLLLILASLVAGFRAFLDLWNKGLKGGRATLRGVLLSLAMLAPFLWYGWLASTNPQLHDVATNPFDPPPLGEAARLRAQSPAAGMNELATYDDTYADLLLAEYPKVGSRRYNAGAERVLVSVRAILEDRGWTITAERGVPETAPADAAENDEDEGGALPKVTSGKPADKAEVADEERVLPERIEVEATAASRILGFRYDVAIQITSEPEATLVDMRSASRFGEHDFGINAAMIRDFLADLDQSLLGIAGEG
ncbi:MAG: DUF1499 domain-containing protein [Rhizobiaceae bacterium]